MEERYYLDGKCIFSYDMDVFSSDEDYTNVNELFIDPIRDEVYKKYYEKQLVQPILEKVLSKNDAVYKVYCDIKPLIENEEISVEYIQDDEDTLLKTLMKEKLNSDEFMNFEELLNETGNTAFIEEMNFLADRNSMNEHLWTEYGEAKKIK